MASSTDLISHQSSSYSAVTASPRRDQTLSTVQAVLQAYRVDMNASSDRCERVAHKAIEASSQSTQAILAAGNANREVTEKAFALVGQSIQSAKNVHVAAISSNQEVSLAAMQIVHQGTESMERVALNAQNLALEDRRARRDERLQELAIHLANWGFVLKEATQPTVANLAREQVGLLTQLIQNLADQKQGELEQEKESNRKRLAASTLLSRTKRINLAKTFIEQSQSSFNDKHLYLPLLLSCALVGCFTSHYFGGQKAAVVAIAIGCAILFKEYYRIAPYYSDLSNKKKWLEIYLKALEILTNKPELKVRSAVYEILDMDLSIDPAQKKSEKTQEILSKIPNNPVIGDPDETTSTIPLELVFLVDHATRQPPKTFSDL